MRLTCRSPALRVASCIAGSTAVSTGVGPFGAENMTREEPGCEYPYSPPSSGNTGPASPKRTCELQQHCRLRRAARCETRHVRGIAAAKGVKAAGKAEAQRHQAMRSTSRRSSTSLRQEQLVRRPQDMTASSCMFCVQLQSRDSLPHIHAQFLKVCANQLSKVCMT